MHCRVILLSASVRRLLFGLAPFSQRLMLFEKVFLIGLKGFHFRLPSTCISRAVYLLYLSCWFTNKGQSCVKWTATRSCLLPSTEVYSPVLICPNIPVSFRMRKGTIWTDPQGKPVQTMARGLARKLNATQWKKYGKSLRRTMKCHHQVKTEVLIIN